MSNARNIIGFDTPSKAKAQEELNNQSSKQSAANVVRGNLDKVKLETIQRLSQLGDAIISDEFQKFEPTQRQQLLLDFAYYSKVADTIL